MKKGYFILLSIILVAWSIYMLSNNLLFLFNENWLVSTTMIFASFIAWSTAEWWWAVAFPVFTKLLNIAWDDAKVFSLMIQSIGMSMAMFVIWIKKIKVLKNVILWWAVWGLLWQILGLSIVLSSIQLKVLFTVLVTFLWVVLASSLIKKEYLYKNEIFSTFKTITSFIVIWLVWGLLTSKMWTGIDMIIFILLTMFYWINAKISTPTTICLMAINSIFWFIISLYTWWITNIVITYWLVSIPVVILFAPIWAIIASKISQKVLISILLFFIFLDITSTVYTVNFTSQVIIFTLQAILLAISFFYIMYFIKTNYVLKQEKVKIK